MDGLELAEVRTELHSERERPLEEIATRRGSRRPDSRFRRQGR